MLGLELVDTDVTNIPMIAADAYGNFIPGPLRGLPQYVTTTGLVEGNLADPAFRFRRTRVRIDTAFLNDIAHSAGPTADRPRPGQRRGQQPRHHDAAALRPARRRRATTTSCSTCTSSAVTAAATRTSR